MLVYVIWEDESLTVNRNAGEVLEPELGETERAEDASPVTVQVPTAAQPER